jgi:phage virion morphogenesis protein
VTITITVDRAQLGAAEAGLNRLAWRLADMTPVMDAIGQYIVASTMERFEKGEGPDGFPWRPSQRARETGGQTLIDTGRLRSSLSADAYADRVDVGTNLIYAAIHQAGGTIRPVNAEHLVFRIGNRTIFADQVDMPARPYLGINKDDQDEIAGIVEAYIEAAVAGQIQ